MPDFEFPRTPRTDLRLIEERSGSADNSYNNNLFRIEMVLNWAVIDKTLTAPPGSPNEGDLYIVGASATGAWAGHDDELAAEYNSVWIFVQPHLGMVKYIEDESQWVYYTGSAYSALFTEASVPID